jgi:hypothetical protein
MMTMMMMNDWIYNPVNNLSYEDVSECWDDWINDNNNDDHHDDMLLQWQCCYNYEWLIVMRGLMV